MSRTVTLGSIQKTVLKAKCDNGNDNRKQITIDNQGVTFIASH